ncbi:MAG: hypothetical protein Kow0068_03560 [Marinilabiliales bacterium]
MNKLFFTAILSALIINGLYAQLLYNNGGTLFVNNGGVLFVDGDIHNNNSGLLQNDGDTYITGNFTNDATVSGNGYYYLSGNWINNNSFNSGLSSVLLEGADQYISGTVSTTFHNLELSGSGIKYLQINTNVDGVLALNDRELATENYSMNILSTNTNAITRTSGFVSSLSNGYLSRATANTASYLFPVGSSLGTLRYRPVEISPASSNINNYRVLFVNHDATTDGYDRTLIDSTICTTIPDFYHRINRISGTDAADISIYYDETADGSWDGLAHWENNPSNHWEGMGTITVNSATPLSSNTVSAWNNFTPDPFILSTYVPVIDLGPDTFVCDNSSIIIDAGSGYDTYLWTGGSNSQTLTVTTNGTYYVTVTSNGCSAIDSIKVALYPAPVANAGENTAICEGESTTLTANGGTIFNWSTTEITQSINVSPTVTTTYWVTVSDGFCFDSDSVTVTVYPIPAADAGPDQIICIGDSIQLSASGGTSYYWSTGESTQSITVQPTITSDYIVTVTDNGCENTDTVNVQVVTNVIADAGPDQNICEGDSVSLQASGGNTYVWSTGSTYAGITIAPSTTTTYYVTVSIGSCSDKDSVTVNVYPVPVAFAGNDTTICSGSYAILTASGGSSYVWDIGNTNQTISVNPLTTTTYTVTVTENGCSASDDVTVYVNPAPQLTTTPDISICQSDSVTLSVNGAVSYLWSTGQTSSTIIVYPSNTTTYYVTGTDINSCSNIDTVNVTVIPSPNAFAGQDISICNGDSVQLNASGGTNYQWYPSSSLSNPYINNPLAFPVQNTTYIVVVSNGTCTDMDTVVINVYPSPQVFAGNDTSVYTNENAQLHATYNQDYQYQWIPSTFLNNPLIYNPVSSPQNTISYTVIVTDTNGCSASDNITITVIEKPAGDIVIYNTFTPNGDHINDYWIIENIEQYPDNKIEIYNRNGHKVFEAENYQNDWDGKYYGTDLPAATYYYIIDLGDGITVYKGDVTIIR